MIPLQLQIGQEFKVNNNWYYIIKRSKLGQGSQSEVYEVQCKFTKKHYAFKKFRLNNAPCILEHIRILQAVKECPNIIKTIDYQVTGQGLFEVKVVMQLGLKSLQDHLNTTNTSILSRSSLTETTVKRTLQDNQAATLAKCLIDGLLALHSKEIVHRDIKPSNIILVSQGPFGVQNPKYVYKIGDLGISKQVNNLNGTNIGTEYYKAPEVLFAMTDPKLRIFEAVDIWSFGMVIFQVCFGFLPFDQQNYQRNKIGQDFVKDLTLKGLDITRLSSWLKDNIRKNFEIKLGTICRKLLKIITRSINYQPQQRATIKQIRDITQLGTGTPRFMKLCSNLTDQNIYREKFIEVLCIKMQQLRPDASQGIKKLINEALGLIRSNEYKQNYIFSETVLQLFLTIKELDSKNQIVYNNAKNLDQILKLQFMLLVSTNIEKFLGSPEKVVNFYKTTGLQEYPLWQYPCTKETIRKLEWNILTRQNK